MKKILLLIILLLSSYNVTAIDSTKIYVDDEWTYEEIEKSEFYNETAIDLFIKTGAIISVNTTRPFPITYSFTLSSGNLTINSTITQIPNILYISQRGGVPVGHGNMLVGNVSVTYLNQSQVIMFNGVNDNYGVGGDPSKGIATEEPEWFAYEHTIYDTTGDYYMTRQTDWIISSTESLGVFTVQPTGDIIQIRTVEETNETEVIYYDYISKNFAYSGFENATVDLPNLTLNSEAQITYTFTLDKDYSMPVYIAQSEPIQVGPALSLNQETKLVEYFLVRDKKSDDNGLPFHIPAFFLVCLVLLRRKNLYNI